MEETPSERRAKLAERARSLQEARESERQKLAAELRERHFRENCDPLREKHSQKILQRTIEERNEQLEQQNLRHMWDVEERRMYDEMYELECLKIEQRYLEDLRKSGASKAEMQRILDRQVRDIARRRAEEDEMEASDIRKLQDTWKREEEDSRAREQAAKEATMRANADNTAFNRSLEEMRRQQQLQEKQDDFDFVQGVLERESREAQKEEEFRDRQRESLRKWATNLAALRHKEAEDNAAQDTFIQRYQDTIQAREDAKKKAEDDARAALMQEVMDARARQIQERMAARQQELLDELAERQRMIKEAALMADLEEKYKHQKRRDALRQRLEIQSQIVAKAQRHAAEEMERLLALETAQKMEEAYMGKVDVAAQHEPQRWHGHKRVEWFH